MNTPFWVIIAMVFVALLNATGQLFNKLASKTLSLSIKGMLKNKNLYMAVTIFFVGAIFYILILPHGEVSIIYSLSALSYLWGMVFAKYLLKEDVNIYKWAGAALIVTGVSVIGFLG
ncbi:MAG TPA: hypothetical protein PL110_13820 [Candidatus Eremiobacteraeota bacterium]|nr:MAG: putative 4-amino-4-deoxy-L-arabinose-phosphoundecaprenol flippase subunit ArnE [bacterium ADurb.Bin363]HPZ09183.1 hypothetical protein [Candidatus Eremiobacteraeota bacterium]